MMEWSFVRQLKNTALLEEMEKEFDICFPSSYRALVEKYNAGIPNKKVFDMGGVCYQVDRLISANLSDAPNIRTAMNWVNQEANVVVPFCMDIVGNMISFGFLDEFNIQIVFTDFETGKTLKVAEDLNEFLGMLK